MGGKGQECVTVYWCCLSVSQDNLTCFNSKSCPPADPKYTPTTCPNMFLWLLNLIAYAVSRPEGFFLLKKVKNIISLLRSCLLLLLFTLYSEIRVKIQGSSQFLYIFQSALTQSCYLEPFHLMSRAVRLTLSLFVTLQCTARVRSGPHTFLELIYL